MVSSLEDVVHTKLVLNLTNSFTTLIGHTLRPVSSMDLVQRTLSGLLREGVEVVREAGFKEHKIPGLPSWTLIRLSATLPPWLTRGLFRRNLAKMVISSMAQDVIVRGRPDTELDSINGYLVRLADEHGVKAPVNRAVYAICAREFARPGFEPMDVAEVWRQIQG